MHTLPAKTQQENLALGHSSGSQVMKDCFPQMPAPLCEQLLALGQRYFPGTRKEIWLPTLASFLFPGESLSKLMKKETTGSRGNEN